MKQNSIQELPKLLHTRLEQLFDVYQTDSGEYFYNILNTVNFNTDNIAPYVYYQHTVMRGETYTVISHKYYNTINLWWLICSFNGIDDPTSLPVPGTVLNILFAKHVPNVLTQISKG